MVGLFIMMIYNFYTVGNMRREARKEDKLGLEAYITAPGGVKVLHTYSSFGMGG